jgi:hypothetical protein
MKRISLLMSMSLLMIGCTETTRLSIPKLTAVKPKLATPVKCGKVSIAHRGSYVSISKSDADCLNAQMRACANDRKRLLIANRANVAQIEKLNSWSNR